jgi:molecular chaperone HscB
MNYFELFGLPIGFQVDTKQLRAAFMGIQRASHPDKFTQANQCEQEEALEKSAIANKAFTLLQNPSAILPYVLEIKGFLEKDEKYALSPDFLMEMMELNEAWMDADDEAAKQDVLTKVKNIENEIFSPIKTYLETSSVDTISQEGMLQIKEYYYKKKYLDRILADFR